MELEDVKIKSVYAGYVGSKLRDEGFQIINTPLCDNLQEEVLFRSFIAPLLKIEKTFTSEFLRSVEFEMVVDSDRDLDKTADYLTLILRRLYDASERNSKFKAGEVLIVGLECTRNMESFPALLILKVQEKRMGMDISGGKITVGSFIPKVDMAGLFLDNDAKEVLFIDNVSGRNNFPVFQDAFECTPSDDDWWMTTRFCGFLISFLNGATMPRIEAGKCMLAAIDILKRLAKDGSYLYPNELDWMGEYAELFEKKFNEYLDLNNILKKDSFVVEKDALNKMLPKMKPEIVIGETVITFKSAINIEEHPDGLLIKHMK